VKSMGAGMVEVAGEPRGADGHKARAYYEGLSKLAIESGRPITFGLFNRRNNPGAWRTTFDIIERTCRQAGACSPRCTAGRSMCCSRSRPSCRSTSGDVREMRKLRSPSRRSGC